jgi:hypothetical protein
VLKKIQEDQLKQWSKGVKQLEDKAIKKKELENLLN